MRKVNPSFAAVLALAVALALLATACATTSSRNRGSLGDAMDKARDDHEGERTVPDEPRDRERHKNRDTWFDSDRESRNQGEYRDSGNGPAPVNENIWLGIRGGSAIAEGGDIVTAFDGDILLGVDLSERSFVDIFAGLKIAGAEDGSALDASLKDSIDFLRIGVEGRFSPFPKWPVLSPHLMGGLGGYMMFWSFRNALIAGNEEIESDSLGGLLFYGGIGINLVNDERFRIGLSLIRDIYLFSDVTSEGFDNDVFGSHDTTRLVGEIGFRLD